MASDLFESPVVSMLADEIAKDELRATAAPSPGDGARIVNPKTIQAWPSEHVEPSPFSVPFDAEPTHSGVVLGTSDPAF
jgi:hypothetical protein